MFYLRIPENFNEDLRKTSYFSDDDFIEAKISEFLLIKKALDTENITFQSIIDVGCGLAAIDIFFARHYPLKAIRLIDGDGTGKKQIGFHTNTLPWCSVAKAYEFMRINGVTLSDTSNKFDLLLSLKSWGHHYPISTYAGSLTKWLTPLAHLVLDIRRGSNGLEELEKLGVVIISLIESDQKSERFLCRWLAKGD